VASLSEPEVGPVRPPAEEPVNSWEEGGGAAALWLGAGCAEPNNVLSMVLQPLSATATVNAVASKASERSDRVLSACTT